MSTTARTSWIGEVIVVGAIYFVIGYGSAALDPAIPDQRRFMWRLTAWIASVAVMSTHIAYEHVRRGDSTAVAARHTALAVALGGFLLALAATVHAAVGASHAPFWRFLIALVVWPTVTGAPVFVVAFAATAILRRWSTRGASGPHR
ncbi:MAG TPA: hypothetical protein VKE51_20985 [Vicinamibacterales bacterium]|nr:hypothetical protein [Vicinamibacterales bacterium]